MLLELDILVTHRMVQQEATLSQGRPRYALDVHVDTYRILQRQRAVSLPQHGCPV